MQREAALLLTESGSTGLLMPTTASAVTDRVIVPFRTTEVSCEGETVRLSGELLLIFHFTEDSSGGFHGHFSLVPRHVRGVSESGIVYKAVGGLRAIFNLSGHGTFTDAFTTQFMLISQGGSDNLLVREVFHITITPTVTLRHS